MFSYYANLTTDDVIGCASTVVWHKIKNISANNEAMLLKLGRNVAPYKIYQMVQSVAVPSSLKSNITICKLHRAEYIENILQRLVKTTWT